MISKIIISVLIGIVVSVIAEVILIVIQKSKKLTETEKIIIEANKEHRILWASLEYSKRIKPVPATPTSPAVPGYYEALYVYKVNDSTYKLPKSMYEEPPRQLRLYYPHGYPSKAVMDDTNIIKRTNYKKSRILVAVIAFMVATIVSLVISFV